MKKFTLYLGLNDRETKMQKIQTVEALSDNRKEFIKELYPNGVNSVTEAENVMQAAKIFNVLDAICK